MKMVLNCEICAQPAHGNHFGVLSCRACAAFFRRAASNPKKSRNASSNCLHGPCEIYENGVFTCKKCRFKRCIEKGMDPSKFQLDRDLISSTTPPNDTTLLIPQSLATFLGRPNFLIFCDPNAESTIKTFVDCNRLIDRATEIFKMGHVKPYESTMSSLEKITLSFEALRLNTSSELQYISYLEKEHTMLFWEQEFLNTAEWLTHFDEFNRVPLSLRVEVLKSIWTVWGRMDKLAKTAEYRRKKLFTRKQMIMVGDEACVDAEKTDIDVSWFTDYPKEHVAYFMSCYHNPNYTKIVDELVEFAPSTTELNFMLLQLCLQQAAKKLQGEVANLTDYLEEVVSNQLHRYYHRDRRTPNYSARVAKMMKINNMMRRDMWEQGERKQLAVFFNVFTLSFSHPEMMCA